MKTDENSNGKELLENIKEYLKQAKKSENEKCYNVAVTLYFKALAITSDLFILRKEGFIPSNHNERFRILETKYPFVYDILDKVFPLYQRSYRTKLTKEHVNILKNDIKTIAKYSGIEINKES